MARRRRKRERTHPTRLLRTKRLLIGILGLLLFGGAAYGLHGYQMRRQAAVLRELGRNSINENEPARAVDFYKQYLVLNPNDLDANSELSAIYEEMAKVKPAYALDAIALLEEKVLSLDPARHEDRRKLAKLYYQIGKFPAARQHLTQLLAANVPTLTNDPELHFLLARCDRLEKKTEEARKGYERSIATKLAPPTTSLELATYLRYELNTPQAIVDADAVMNRLIQEHPQDIESRLVRCRYRLGAGDRRGAREDVELAYNLPGGGTNGEIILQLASLTALDDPKFARTLLEKALKDQPENMVLTLGLAEMMIATNSEAQARQLLLDAARKLPDGDLRLLDVGDRLIDLKNFEAALTTAARLNSDERWVLSANYLRGRVNVMRGDWPQAIPLLESALPALQRNTNLNKKALLSLAVGHGAANDLPNQLRCFEAAWNIDPTSVTAQFGVADTLATMGQSAKAADRYRDLASKNPLARVRYAKLKFAEILGQPDRSRNWDEFERVLGPKPYAPEIEVLAANALFLQKKPAEAIQQLSAALVTDPKQVQSWLSLALLRGLQDPDAGLKTLDEAEKKIGDSVDLRLLRAQMVTRDPKSFDLPKLLTLAERGVTEFPPADRFRLYSGLSDLLASLNKRTEALTLLHKATAEMPFDLPTRLALFDLANNPPNPAILEKTLDEIRKLDGADGAVTIVAEVAREFVQNPQPDAATRVAWVARLKIARDKRESWGRVHVLLGDVAYMESRLDAALVDYRKGIDRGERSEALIRRVVQILWERQNYQEATQLLARMTANGGLPTDLQRQFVLMQSALTDNKEQSLTWVRSPEVVNSKNYRDHLIRGTVFFIFGSTDEAMTALQLAKSLKDDAPELWVSIVRFLAATGQKDAALQQANAAEKRLRQPDVMVPNPAAIPLAIGECREIVGDFAAAEVEFKKAWAIRETDPAAPLRLYVLYQRTNKPKEADEVLTKAMATGKTEAAFWARRMKAVAAVSVPEGFKNVPKAVEWLDENLRDGNNSTEDIRAKAFVMAIDPFQRQKGIDLLNDTTARAPLSPDQNFFLAKLHLQSGQPDSAEKALIEATKAGPLASPDHLALLAHVQLDRNNLFAAKQTLSRLKLRAPNTWDTQYAEARYLAKDGRQAEGAKVILGFPWPGDAVQKVVGLGRALEDIGSFDEAETLYRGLANSDKGPTGHIPLVQYLIRRGKGAAAIVILQGILPVAPIGTTARLLSISVRTRVAVPLTGAEKPAWDKTVAEIESWVGEKLKDNPKSEELLTASAELADARGAYDDAIGFYTRAAQISTPETRGTQLNNVAILTALFKKDGGDSTLRLINEAIGLRGPSPSLLDSRAIIRMASGEYQEALRDLTIASGSDPRPVFQYHLALVYHKLGNASARSTAMTEAKKLGLTKASLHPLEWEEYRKLEELK